MGQKTVRFSDLSGQLIMHDDALARIVVHEHPELGDGPVEIEALTDEAEAMEEAALRVAVIDLYLPDDIEPRRIVMEADAFDKLATQSSMAELLTAARPVRRNARSSRAGGSRADRLDYATREHAGKPHKGKITDTEKQLVRDHLDEINDRLAGQGLRTISLTDPEHVERYSLQDLARERNLELEFGFSEEGRHRDEGGRQGRVTPPPVLPAAPARPWLASRGGSARSAASADDLDQQNPGVVDRADRSEQRSHGKPVEPAATVQDEREPATVHGTVAAAVPPSGRRSTAAGRHDSGADS